MIHRIHVHIGSQTLDLITPSFSKNYPVSTAANGAGQADGSFCTPLGHHIVKTKVGYRAHKNTVFFGRKPQAALYDPHTPNASEKDWILTRILWLSGCEPGINRLGNVDTKNRYIYIHGTPDSEGIGVPNSHGCIRMRNDDVIELFKHTPLYTQVLITED